MDWVGAGPLGEEDVEELRSERSIRGLKVNSKRVITSGNSKERVGLHYVLMFDSIDYITDSLQKR